VCVWIRNYVSIYLYKDVYNLPDNEKGPRWRNRGPFDAEPEGEPASRSLALDANLRNSLRVVVDTHFIFTNRTTMLADDLRDA